MRNTSIDYVVKTNKLYLNIQRNRYRIEKSFQEYKSYVRELNEFAKTAKNALSQEEYNQIYPILKKCTKIILKSRIESFRKDKEAVAMADNEFEDLEVKLEAKNELI